MNRKLMTALICGASLLALGACGKKPTETKSEMTVTQTVTTGDKAADNLKEGLWNISMKNDKMPMVMKTTVCVGKDGIADIEKASKADISPDCETPKVERAAGKISSSITCKKDGKETEINSEFTFSSDESFEQSMSIKLKGGTSGDTTFNQTISGTYKGACPEGMKVGDVKMNFGG